VFRVLQEKAEWPLATVLAAIPEPAKSIKKLPISLLWLYVIERQDRVHQRAERKHQKKKAESEAKQRGDSGSGSGSGSGSDTGARSRHSRYSKTGPIHALGKQLAAEHRGFAAADGESDDEEVDEVIEAQSAMEKRSARAAVDVCARVDEFIAVATRRAGAAGGGQAATSKYCTEAIHARNAADVHGPVAEQDATAAAEVHERLHRLKLAGYIPPSLLSDHQSHFTNQRQAQLQAAGSAWARGGAGDAALEAELLLLSGIRGKGEGGSNSSSSSSSNSTRAAVTVMVVTAVVTDIDVM
jgi:hypothetical protein